MTRLFTLLSRRMHPAPSSQQLIQAALNNNMLIIADKTQLINVSLTVPDLTNTYV